ncbi:hypothetical protein ACPW96_01815 [Micromonospora sp. DT81.3]|uniref:hypothetical protein n=1 Tax=Actinomycetes TaxID=1760 RepID=UPI003CF46A3B
MSNPQDPQDLPEGVINNEPAGGWGSEEASATEADSDRSSSGLPPNTPTGTDATADAPGQPAEPSGPEAPSAPAGPIEGDGAGQGLDPDLATDADLEQGRGEDPSLDPGARERQEGL